MKKSLIALAALAVVSAASAQSSVTISGNLDLAATSTDWRGHQVGAAAAANGSSTSALFFKGEEDIGGGIKAVFQYEIDPDFSQTQGRTSGTSATGSTSNVTSSVGNGQSFVGLNTNFGNVKLGTPNLATLDINALGNSGFGTAIGSGYRVSSFDAVRLQNTAKFESAVYSGFSASLNAVAKNTAQSNAANTAFGNNINQIEGRDGATEIGLKYANGPVAISYANLQVTQNANSNPVLLSLSNGTTPTAAKGFVATGGTFTLNSLAAAYAITPEASAALFYQTVKSSGLVKADATLGGVATAFDRSTYGVSGSYRVTPVISLMANYAQTSTGAKETAATASAKTKVLGLGADYSLSKRTALYVRYERDQDAAGLRAITGYTAVTGNTTYTATAVGIRHAF